MHFTQILTHPPDCLCAKSSGSSHIPPEIEMMKMLPDFAQQAAIWRCAILLGQLVSFCNVWRNRPQGALLGWLGVLGVPKRLTSRFARRRPANTRIHL
jgi:hypothetical protein